MDCFSLIYFVFLNETSLSNSKTEELSIETDGATGYETVIYSIADLQLQNLTKTKYPESFWTAEMNWAV